MLAQLYVGSLVAASTAGLVVAPEATTQSEGAQQPGERPTMLAGTFVRVVNSNPHRFVQRFTLRTAAMGDVEVELAMTGTVTRNGQPARLVDLKPGDQTVVMLMGSSPPLAACVEATGP